MKRGLAGVKFVISDLHDGFKGASRNVSGRDAAKLSD